MSIGTLEKCIINQGLQDKKTLSQKLIARNSRFLEFLHCEIVCHNLRFWDSVIVNQLVGFRSTFTTLFLNEFNEPWMFTKRIPYGV